MDPADKSGDSVLWKDRVVLGNLALHRRRWWNRERQSTRPVAGHGHARPPDLSWVTVRRFLHR